MMDILNFRIEEKVLSNHLVDFANVIKTKLFEYNEHIFDRLDINKDNVFLEPALFYYFYGSTQNSTPIPLEQLLWGYLDDDLKPDVINVVSDRNGIINLPNYGYYKFELSGQVQLLWDKNEKVARFICNGIPISLKLIEDVVIQSSGIRLCQHMPGLLHPILIEPIAVTMTRFYPVINSAYKIMQKLMPDFCNCLQQTTREICVFNSKHDYSKAAMSYYGTAFLNIQGQDHDEVFFIDDIAHQSGHILFYTLTMPAVQFFKPTPRTLIKEFTHIDWEARDIYGCFHGLFTYTTILYCLETCLDANVFEGKQKHETTGRLAFYMDKFRKDLSHMNDPLILTDKGFEFFDMLKAGYDHLYAKYRYVIRKADFSNQNYLFNYPLYVAINPMID